MAIRYDEKLALELARTVKNYNAKISRLAGKEGVVTPERIRQATLKQQFTDRRELLRELAKLKEFTKRGAEKEIITESGLKTSVYQMKIHKKGVRRAKASLTRKIHLLESRTKDSKIAELSDDELINLRTKRAKLNTQFQNLSKSLLQTQIKIVEMEDRRTTRADEFKDNYINQILETLAYQGGISEEDLKKLKQTLQKVPAKKFWYNLVKGNAKLSNLMELYAMLQSGIDVSQQINDFVDDMLGENDAMTYIEDLAFDAIRKPLSIE